MASPAAGEYRQDGEAQRRARVTVGENEEAPELEPLLGEPLLGEPLLGEPLLGEPLLGEPLLGDRAAGSPDSADGQQDGNWLTLNLQDVEEAGNFAQYFDEARRILALALPLTFTQFFSLALGIISLLYVGRLGQEKLAIAVLATSMMNVTGSSVFLGLLGALDTLCGQAWGAKNYRSLGINLQKALITTLFTAAAICLLWAHMEKLLLIVGQQAVIAAGTARYLRLAIPALVCLGLFECLKRYLMAQGVVKPVSTVSAAALALAPAFNWLLIFHVGLGIDGAVYALDATWLSMLAMLTAYLAWHEYRQHGTPQQTWHGWSLDCLRGLGQYYSLAIPSTLMVCLEWWAYELTIFMAGWLHNPSRQVAAMGVMMQGAAFVYMPPSALSCAVTVRVSNLLGARMPQHARRSAHAATVLAFCTQFSLALTMVLGRNIWASFFTDVPGVIAACATAFPIMAGTTIGDGMAITISGILRGAGRQELGAWLNLLGYWGIGLPAAYMLGVRAGLGINGLWGGLVICSVLQALVMLTVMLRFNWQREADAALKRVSMPAASADNCTSGLLACEDVTAKLDAGGMCENSTDVEQ